MMEPDIGHNSGRRTRCIYRAHGERGYTKLRNAFLQDRRLSFDTRGLLGFLLSLPDDWEVTVQSIIASGPAGRDRVYRMLKEAEQFGYILPEQGRKQAGKFDRQLYLVSDDPAALIERAALEILKMEAAKQPLPEKPEPGEEPVTPLPLTANTDAAKNVVNQGVSPLPDLPYTAEPFTAEPLTEKPEADKKNIEGNINNTPPLDPPQPEAEVKPTKRKGRGSKTRLPADWQLDPQWRADTRKVFGATDEQIDIEVARFRRYWTSPDAKNPMKADWKRAWENWFDRAMERGIRTGGAPPSRQPWQQRRDREDAALEFLMSGKGAGRG